jgi:hypothetical protein
MTISERSIDFVIIGAAKAGTTSLASWLGSHPDVCMSNPKETMFFGSPKRFDQGLDYYHSRYFAHYCDEPLIGEATPAYSDRDRHPATAKRLFNVNPDAKIIYIVRHPLRKAESTWQMHVNLTPDLATTTEEEICGVKAREGFACYLSEPSIFENLVNTCSYSYQLEAWLEQFSEERIHVMYLEDLVTDRAKQLSHLCTFLAIDPQPLLAMPLNVENSLSKRRVHRRFVGFLSKSRIQRLFPVSARRAWARSALFSIPQSSLLKPIWPAHLFVKFTEAVQSDVQQFLLNHGKSEDFYRFHQAET